MIQPVGEGYWQTLTYTRVDLKLPELPQCSGSESHVYYTVGVYQRDYTWDEYPGFKNVPADQQVTSLSPGILR